MKLPIIVISGVSGAGKTSLSLELGRRYGIPNLISSDLLRALWDSRTCVLPMNYPVRVLDSWKNVSSCRSPGSVWSALLAESNTVAANMLPLVNFASRRGHSIIVDGFHLIPSVVANNWPDAEYFGVALSGIDRDTLCERQAQRVQNTHIHSKPSRSDEEMEIFLHLDREIARDAVSAGWLVADLRMSQVELADFVGKCLGKWLSS